MTTDVYLARPVTVIALPLAFFRAFIVRSVHRGSMTSKAGVRVYLFSTASRLILGLTQPPIQYVSGAVSSGGKVAGA
jgi:hypothetical protein